MPIAAPLLAGLEAYRRGAFAHAAQEWERAGAALSEPVECDLLIAVGRLATALEANRRHDGETAARVFAEAEAALSGLPDTVLGVDVLALRAELARGLAVAAAVPPQPLAAQRFPLGATLRFLSLFVLLAAGAALLRFTPLGHMLDRQRVVAFFLGLRKSTWAPVMLIGLYMLLAPIGLPMTPLIIAGGIVFGRVWGAVYNIVGCVLGAAISYQVGRLLGRDFVRRLGRKRLKRIETLLRRRGFWSLVGVRYLPIPFPVINYGAAIAGLPFSTFLLSTVLGLIPALIVYTYFAASIFDVTQGGDPAQLRNGIIAFLAVMSVSLAPTVIQQVRRRRRYRRLVVERHARRLRLPRG